MTPAVVGAVLSATTSAILTFVEVLVAAMLFAHGQPRRRSVFVCGGVACLALAACAVAHVLLVTQGQWLELAAVPGAWSAAGARGSSASIAMATLICAVELLACAAVLAAALRVRVWACAYCATAGYALQNLASGISAALFLTPVGQAEPNLEALVTAGCCAVTFTVAYLAFVRHIPAEGLMGKGSPAMLGMIAVVIFGIIGFDLVLKYVLTPLVSLSVAFALRAFHALVCVFVIIAEVELVVARQLASERDAAERLLAERERQYDLSRANIEAINIKCHDLRHQIRTLAEGRGAVDAAVLEDVAREVNVYDSLVQTGNEALDTILTEKSLICEQRDITLTCIADGAALEFMSAADLYALFGNALENAIDAASELGDRERRSVSLLVRKKAGMVSVHVENYYDGADLCFVDGLPSSTKGDALNHGFGTRSMRQIVERYGGTLTLTAKGQTFCLDALLPAA